ncbi:MAG: hypothetical protein ACI85O_002179 [Saprospiraceae bacterium]|jgi:hypothetical protein
MNQDSKLETLVAEYRSIQLAKSHLAKLQVRLREDHKTLVEIGFILEKEYQDVLRMKKFKVKTLFREFAINNLPILLVLFPLYFVKNTRCNSGYSCVFCLV